MAGGGGEEVESVGSGGSDEYEYVTLTSAEVLEKLEEVSIVLDSVHKREGKFQVVGSFTMQAWQNEKFAPELLEHKTEVVDCVLEQIKEMVRWRGVGSDGYHLSISFLTGGES